MNEKLVVIFTRINNFKSKKKDKEYYTVEYLDAENFKHYIDFISKEQYETIEDLELDPLEEINVVFKIGFERNLVFDHFER